MKASLASDRLRGSGADSEAGSGSTARPPETSRSSGLRPSGQDVFVPPCICPQTRPLVLRSAQRG